MSSKAWPRGPKLVVDGRALRVPGHPEGYFLGPCLFDHVSPEMSIQTEEIFGPVLCVLRAPGYAEALALVNANHYGNGGPPTCTACTASIFIPALRR
jgi:malonate-semialdehyde dehydrogenase (acetylating)/methylmalonate-semialdehyde dehydrogenase